MAVNIQEAEQKIKKYKETLEAYIKASMSANDDSPNKIDEKEQKEIDRLKDMIVKIEARILELKKNDNNEALPVNLNNADDKEDALRKKIFKKIIIQRKEFHRWRGILVNQHNLQENKRAAEFNLKEGYDKVFKASEVLNQMINTIVTKFKDKKFRDYRPKTDADINDMSDSLLKIKTNFWKWKKMFWNAGGAHVKNRDMVKRAMIGEDIAQGVRSILKKLSVLALREGLKLLGVPPKTADAIADVYKDTLDSVDKLVGDQLIIKGKKVTPDQFKKELGTLALNLFADAVKKYGKKKIESKALQELWGKAVDKAKNEMIK